MLLGKKMPFTYSKKKNELPRKGSKGLYSETHRTLKKEIREDTNKWKHIPCSWIGELTPSKCPYYPKQFIDSMQSLLKYQ